MKDSNYSKQTLAVHAGTLPDPEHHGTVSPIFPSAAYDYEDVPETLYPRYFNTPNQKALVQKLAALENAEDGLIFSSGMAAILTSMLAVLRTGDHCIVPQDIYGGTYHAIVHEFQRFQMEYTLVDMTDLNQVRNSIRKNTRLIYLETPSNPTLAITDLEAIVALARESNLLTLIDNTFASPVNQNPLDFGIDIVTHSGTKYIGGHSDLSCGAALASKDLIAQIHMSAIHFGGNLDSQACWLVERSLKTLVIRVRQQNENALAIARFLENHPAIQRVFYPGLPSHRGHQIAARQMKGGFGGMLSFETRGNAFDVLNNLNLISRAVSLGGVESTITSPVRTSHAKMDAATREKIGVGENMLRLSVGIEEVNDLIQDLKQALES